MGQDASTDLARGPLTGMRVLEMGSTVAGPFCGRLLADFGAEVIKIEPADGDPVRTMGKHFGGKSLYAASIFRNKRLISVDLHRAEGRDIARAIALSCDVVVENFKPGTLEGWGLGWERPFARQSAPGDGAHLRLRPGRPLRLAPRLRRHLRGGERLAAPDRRSRPAAVARRRLDDRLHHRTARGLRRRHGADGARGHGAGAVHRRRALRVRLQLHGAVDPGLREAGARRQPHGVAPGRKHAQQSLPHRRRRLHPHHRHGRQPFPSSGPSHGPARARRGRALLQGAGAQPPQRSSRRHHRASGRRRNRWPRSSASSRQPECRQLASIRLPTSSRTRTTPRGTRSSPLPTATWARLPWRAWCRGCRQLPARSGTRAAPSARTRAPCWRSCSGLAARQSPGWNAPA